MATTYYDFGAATNGAGTSADPKNTWATPGNGDVIRIKRGCTWARSTQLNLSTFTGLTFEAWYNADGSDDPTKPKPIITHTIASTFGWNFQGDGIHRIYDLNFIGCTTNTNGGLIGSGLVAATSANASIELHRCEFSGTNYNAIRFSGTGAAAAPRCVVKFCNFDNIGEDCIYGGALYFEVGYCRMTRISTNTTTGDGVGFLGLDPVAVWVHDNYIDHSEVDSKHCVIIDVTTPGAGLAVIERNTFIGYGSATAEAASHTVVNGDAKMIVRGNTIHSAGIAINLDGAASEVYSNDIRPINIRAASPGIIAVQASNCLIYNNTMTAQAALSAAARGVDIATATSGTAVKSVAFAGIPIAVRSASTGANPTVSNNSFWQVTSQYSSAGDPITGSNDTTADPQLTATYRPKATSPLIGAGTHLGYRRDIEGKQRPNPPSIGAYDVATLRI
jgi:hypothetical protein